MSSGLDNRPSPLVAGSLRPAVRIPARASREGTASLFHAIVYSVQHGARLAPLSRNRNPGGRTQHLQIKLPEMLDAEPKTTTAAVHRAAILLRLAEVVAALMIAENQALLRSSSTTGSKSESSLVSTTLDRYQ